MRWFIYSVGKTKQVDFAALEKDYCSRLKKFCRIELRYFKTMEQLADELEDSSAELIALTETGEQYSTAEFVDWCTAKQLQARDVIFVIGDSAGFTDAVLTLCSKQLSLSRFTFPHECARVLLLEQLYRVATIQAHLPYHK